MSFPAAQPRFPEAPATQLLRTPGLLLHLYPHHQPSPDASSPQPSLTRVTFSWFSPASWIHHPLANEGKGRSSTERSLVHCLTCMYGLNQSKKPRQPPLSNSQSVPVYPPEFPFSWFYSIYSTQNSRNFSLGNWGMVSRTGVD